MKIMKVLKFIVTILAVLLCVSKVSAQWIQVENDVSDTTYAFGYAISLDSSGTIFAVGDAKGRAAVYERIDNNWAQMGKTIIKNSNFSQAGWKLNLNGNGKVVAIGDYTNGDAQVFEYDGTDWRQRGENLSGKTHGFFGHSVGLNSNGDILVAAAPLDDSTLINDQGIYVYKYENGNWLLYGEKQTDYDSLNHLGRQVCINSDGSIFASSGFYGDTGMVRIYRMEENKWKQLGNDILCESTGYLFGEDIRLSNDGYTIAIGVVGSLFLPGGTHYCYFSIYNYKNGTWVKKGTDIPGDWSLEFGHVVSINATGDVVAACAPSYDGGPHSYAKVFGFNGTNWEQRGQTIIAEGGKGPKSVSLNDAGNVMAIGEPYYIDATSGTVGRMRIFGLCDTYSQKFITDSSIYYMPNGVVVNKSGVYNDTIPNKAGCDSIISYNVTIEHEATGLIDVSNPRIAIHPNPTKGTIAFEGDDLEFIKDIKVVSITGMEVHCEIRGNMIDLNSCNRGIYIIQFQFKDKVITGKVILE
jgi:hypothetical protein